MVPASRWKTVRPWLPPASPRLELQVIDVSSTAVSLGVFTAADAGEADTTTPRSVGRSITLPGSVPEEDSEFNVSPAISIKLNGQPWSQVAHAGSPIVEGLFEDSNEQSVSSAVVSSDTSGTRRRSPSTASVTAVPSKGVDGPGGATIVIYGLEPGTEYEVELHVVVEGSEGVASPTTAGAVAERISNSSPTPESERVGEGSATEVAVPTPTDALDVDGPPPPYTCHDPSPASSCSTLPASSLPTPSVGQENTADLAQASTSSEPPESDEAQLRAMLKALRATSRRSETSLTTSLTTLKRSLDKAIKEDHRAKQRAATLDDSMRRLVQNTSELVASTFEISESLPQLEVEVGKKEKELTSQKHKLIDLEKKGQRDWEYVQESIKCLKKSRDETVKQSEEVKKESDLVEREVEELEKVLSRVEEEIRVTRLQQQEEEIQRQRQQQASIRAPSTFPTFPHAHRRTMTIPSGQTQINSKSTTHHHHSIAFQPFASTSTTQVVSPNLTSSTLRPTHTSFIPRPNNTTTSKLTPPPLSLSPMTLDSSASQEAVDRGFPTLNRSSLESVSGVGGGASVRRHKSLGNSNRVVDSKRQVAPSTTGRTSTSSSPLSTSPSIPVVKSTTPTNTTWASKVAHGL